MDTQLIFLGAPGSGKGTQAVRLVKEKGYKHISTGDLLRSEIRKESELGKKVKKIVDEGGLVDDQTVLALLQSNCLINKNAYVFDGFPRNFDQAKSLDQMVLRGAPTKVIYFDLDVDLLIERLKYRRTCSKCNEIYNLKTSPPAVEDTCNKCGHKGLIQRQDDQAEVVKKRMDVFKNTISPVLSYYSERGILQKVDAAEDMDSVYKDILKNL